MKQFFFLLLCAFFTTGLTQARDLPQSNLESYEAWDPETVHAFERILVQDGGRVKPIYTVSRFTLMSFSGKSRAKFETKDGEKHNLHYSEWMLNVLFRGEIAKDIPVFVVDNSEAVVQIGVSPKSKKRTVYSYNDLVPGRARLAELAAQYNEKHQKFVQSEKRDRQFELDPVEGMVRNLGGNISSFEFLVGQLGFARDGKILVNENILPQELLDLAAKTSPMKMLREMPMPEMSIDQLVRVIQSPPASDEAEKTLQDVFRLYFFFANTSRGLNFFPPQDREVETWLSASDVMIKGLESKEARPWCADQLESIEKLVDAEKEGEENFRSAIDSFVESQHAVSDPAGEGLYVDQEISLYRSMPFHKALYFFVGAFLVLAFSWLAPGSTFGKIMLIIASAFALAGLVFDVYGIWLRCIVRQRPPITNLYDTIIFITATAVFLGLLIELFTRISIGTLLAVIAGVGGMFLSIKYEAKEASDTMDPLVAVLDTNFWLATHVTIINIGYAAALAAAVIGVVYLGALYFSKLRSMSLDTFAKWHGIIFATVLVLFLIIKVPSDKALQYLALYLGIAVVFYGATIPFRRESDASGDQKNFFRTLTRMNYGIICFCLLFSLVGTVLGGIWANYSWGRFWGWDPKENGALMICLWTLVILHGRMAGWIRDLGVHMQSIFLAIITTFSWWGVNNLGVGLHSYGFTEGVWGALYTSWAILGIFLFMGVVIWFSNRAQKASRREAPASRKSTATA